MSSDLQWRAAIDGLARWHASEDRAAAGPALAFIEVAVRLRIPAAARRRWPAEQVEDAVQGFLLRLLRKPLPADILHPAAYIQTAFSRWCIDVERGRKRTATEPWEETAPEQPVAPEAESKEEVERIETALDGLSMEDRVALKITTVPDMLTWAELSWLGGRAGLSANEARDRVVACPSVYELTMLFDPGAEPRDAKERRDRMERFRKRRERARDRLRAQLEDGS